MAYITRIRVHDLNNAGLLDAILPELTDMCNSFTCYPKEGIIIADTPANYGGQDLIDTLRARRINVEHVVAKVL